MLDDFFKTQPVHLQICFSFQFLLSLSPESGIGEILVSFSSFLNMSYLWHACSFLSSPIYTNAFESLSFPKILSPTFPPRLLVSSYLPQLQYFSSSCSTLLFTLRCSVTSFAASFPNLVSLELEKSKTSALFHPVRQSANRVEQTNKIH